jgi:hypothetical protein
MKTQISKEMHKVLRDLLVGIGHDDTPVVEENGEYFLKYDSIRIRKGIFTGWKVTFLWKDIELFTVEGDAGLQDITLTKLRGLHKWDLV